MINFIVQKHRYKCTKYKHNLGNRQLVCPLRGTSLGLSVRTHRFFWWEQTQGGDLFSKNVGPTTSVLHTQSYRRNTTFTVLNPINSPITNQTKLKKTNYLISFSVKQDSCLWWLVRGKDTAPNAPNHYLYIQLYIFIV